MKVKLQVPIKNSKWVLLLILLLIATFTSCRTVQAEENGQEKILRVAFPEAE